MKKSEQINELAGALALAQAEIKDAEKDRENPHFKSQYATLASVWAACRGPLSKHKLSVYQSPSTTEDRQVVITTILMHASGQWIEDEIVLTPVKTDPQGFGSAITYGRRYALMAVAGVAPGDESDDDANAASAGAARPRAQTAPKGPAGPPITTTPKGAPTPPDQAKIHEQRAKALAALINPETWPTGSVAEYCKLAFGTNQLTALTDEQFITLCDKVAKQTATQAKALAGWGNKAEVAEPGSLG